MLYTDCCDSGYCAGYPPNCFCDHDCHSRGDCCRDVGDICPECKSTKSPFSSSTSWVGFNCHVQPGVYRIAGLFREGIIHCKNITIYKNSCANLEGVFSWNAITKCKSRIYLVHENSLYVQGVVSDYCVNYHGTWGRFHLFIFDYLYMQFIIISIP